MNQPRNNSDFNPYESAQQTPPQGEQPETPVNRPQAPGNDQQATQQPSGYAVPPQAPYTQPSYGAPQPPANPYAAAAPKPAKKWPWVLLGCALAFLMGLGAWASPQ